MYILDGYHINYGMEHVVYLMVKKGNRGNREPVVVECLRLGQMRLSRVTLLEAYLEAWEQPSHVCGVIWDKIKERCMEERRREEDRDPQYLGTEESPDASCLSQAGPTWQEDATAPAGPTWQADTTTLASPTWQADATSQADPIWQAQSAVCKNGEGPEEKCRKTVMSNMAGKSHGNYGEKSAKRERTQSGQCNGAGRSAICGEGASLRELHRYFPDYQVWDRSFQGYLQRHGMAAEWLRVWRVPVYDQYGEPEQLQFLFDNVEGWRQFSQILVLGYDPGMAVWLPELARRARGIDFYLDYEPRGMEDIREWIFEEYGLVTQWRILGNQAQEAVGEGTQENGKATGRRTSYPGLGQYLRSYGMPCLVLDFTDAEDVNVTGLKPGSMWWDMGAKEEKRHLLEDRPLGVQYVSMKTLWRDLVTASGT